MRVLILGATGGTGQHVLRLALARGHEVTVLVRRPEALPPGVDRSRIHTGDAADASVLSAAVAGQDAVISALGIGKSFKPDGLMARSIPAIVRAMEAARVRRIVWLSGFGVGVTFRDAPLGPRIFMRTLLRAVYADKLAGEEHLGRSALDWTIVYATALTDKPATGRYRIGERLALRGFPSISRADVADFLVKQVDDPSFVQKRVLIA